MKRLFLFFVFLSSLFFCFSISFALSRVPKVIVKNTVSKNEQTANDVLDTAAPVQVVTDKAIKKTAAQSMKSVLQSLPGMQVTDMYDNGSRLTVGMRGFGDNAASNTLIMVDGLPIENADMGLPALNLFDLSQIQSLDILPGSAGVLLGDQAVGGVVNIETKTPDRLIRTFALDYGSFASHKTQVSLGDRLKNGFSYLIHGSYYKTHGYREHNDNRINRLNLKLAREFDRKKIYFNYQKFNEHLELPGSLSRAQVNEDRQQAENDVDDNDQDIDFLQAGLSGYLNDLWKVRIDGSLRKMKGEGKYLFDTYSPATIIPFSDRRSVTVLKPEIRGVINLFNYSFLPVAGFEALDGSYRYLQNDLSMQQYAFYGQVKVPINLRWTLYTGIRHAKALYDFNTAINPHDTDTANATNLELSYQFNRALRFFIRRADSYRFPKLDEDMFTLDQKPLKTQLGTSYEGGFAYESSKWGGDLSVYRLNLKNEIACIPIKTSFYRAYNVNLDPTKRTGLTAHVHYKWNSHLQIQAGADLLQAKFDSGLYAGNRIPFVSNELFHLSASYQLTEALQFFAQDNFTGNRYASNDDANEQPKLGGYSLYNLGVNYVKKDYSIALRLNNIFNKKYDSYAVASQINGQMQTRYYPAAGFNGILDISIHV